MATRRARRPGWPDTLVREEPDGLRDAEGNAVFCDTEGCESEATAEVKVSVNRRGDQVRRYCAACRAAYGTGVQHAMFHLRGSARGRRGAR